MSAARTVFAAVIVCVMGFGQGGGITLLTGHFDRKAYQENRIITSLNNCPLCAQKEPCLHSCRESEKKSWSECLNRCLGDNPLLLETFTSIIKSQERSLNGFGS